MENLWYGNWNRHVCHKWKYEVDRPFRSLEVNPGKKHKCCSRSCLWSQVQRDTFGPGNSQTLGCLWTKHHRCIDMWNWTEMPTVSCRLWAKTVMYKFCFIWVEKYVGQKRGTIGSHWNADYLLENFSRKHHENVVYQKLKHLDVIFRVLVKHENVDALKKN